MTAGARGTLDGQDDGDDETPMTAAAMRERGMVEGS
jgi:hypothetical protein